MDNISLMALIETGVNEIDADHGKLLACLSNLNEAVIACSNIDSVIDVAAEFRNSCKNHFYTEEEFMRKIRYSNADAHVKLHGDKMAYLDKVIEGIALTGECPDPRIITFMATWLQEHMRTMDMDLADEILRHRKGRRR